MSTKIRTQSSTQLNTIPKAKQWNKMAGALLSSAIFSITLSFGPRAFAAVSAEEAKQLGGSLTAFGAEENANADASIPAYQGGEKISLPANFKPGSGRYPDPFKNEKPLYAIDAKNMGQYAGVLAAGMQELLKRFPDYKVNVYPTHRTMIYPEWVLRNTLKNATSAKLVGEVEGDGVEGAYGGIPFPIPKNGYEVMWNYLLGYKGPLIMQRFRSYFIDRTGLKTMVSDQETKLVWPYYDKSRSKLSDTTYYITNTASLGPPSQAGLISLQKASINHMVRDDFTWFYTPGQRRVRVAPEAKYDMPVPPLGGVFNFDEISGIAGRMDRFDFKLMGKKELLVPYNSYRAIFEPGFIGSRHENSEQMRWEKHRVWVVEATLKPGKRHVFSKRVFYVDEDTWGIVLNDSYDQSGSLYRVQHFPNYVLYDKPRHAPPGQVIYDLTKGTWATTVDLSDPATYCIPHDDAPPAGGFTPEVLGARGVR